MKNTIKFMLFLTLTVLALFCIPNFTNAASTETATDESTLKSAIENVDDGGTVEIQNNITVTGPIVIQKNLLLMETDIQFLVLLIGLQHLEIKLCSQHNFLQDNLH